MSIKAIDKVWTNSELAGVDLLCLLALADYAHEDGTNAFPKIDTLRQKLRYKTDRAVQKILAKLIENGELVRHDQKGPYGVNLYDIVFQDGSNWETIKKRCQQYKTALPWFTKGVQMDRGGCPNGQGGGEQTDTPLTGEQMDTQIHDPSIDPSETPPTEKQALNNLADAVASVCAINIKRATKSTQANMKKFILEIFKEGATPEKALGFGDWWYLPDPPSLWQFMENWDRYQASGSNKNSGDNSPFSPEVKAAYQAYVKRTIDNGNNDSS